MWNWVRHYSFFLRLATCIVASVLLWECVWFEQVVAFLRVRFSGSRGFEGLAHTRENMCFKLPRLVRFWTTDLANDHSDTLWFFCNSWYRCRVLVEVKKGNQMVHWVVRRTASSAAPVLGHVCGRPWFLNIFVRVEEYIIVLTPRH